MFETLLSPALRQTLAFVIRLQKGQYEMLQVET